MFTIGLDCIDGDDFDWFCRVCSAVPEAVFLLLPVEPQVPLILSSWIRAYVVQNEP